MQWKGILHLGYVLDVRSPSTTLPHYSETFPVSLGYIYRLAVPSGESSHSPAYRGHHCLYDCSTSRVVQVPSNAPNTLQIIKAVLCDVVNGMVHCHCTVKCDAKVSHCIHTDNGVIGYPIITLH